MIKIDAQNVDFYYGDFHALKNISMPDRSQYLGSLYRPVGLWQIYFPPLVQPHERLDSRHTSGR